MKVDVYRNLNDGCLSIKSRESSDYGHVVAHKPKVSLRDVEFVVREAGQQKTRDSGTRNVHAFARGVWDERVQVLYGDHITYDPFEHDTFVTVEDERPVREAGKAVVTTDGIFASNVSFDG